MDGFDLKPERKPRAKVNASAVFWNLMTVVMLLSTICLALYFVTIYKNPASPLNPFQPQALPTVYATITPTITPIQLEPTWTATVTLEPTATRTTAPTWTLLPALITPTITDTPSASDTPLPGPTETPAASQSVAPGLVNTSITYQAVSSVHPGTGCSWLGVGGKVLAANGQGLPYQTIQVGGFLNGVQVGPHITLSGSASAYGPGGFEVVLGSQTVASTQSMWIQLFDDKGKMLTDRIYFDTYTDCNKNLVMIVFTLTQ
jgi:hypothetical protein